MASGSTVTPAALIAAANERLQATHVVRGNTGAPTAERTADQPTLAPCRTRTRVCVRMCAGVRDPGREGHLRRVRHCVRGTRPAPPAPASAPPSCVVWACASLTLRARTAGRRARPDGHRVARFRGSAAVAAPSVRRRGRPRSRDGPSAALTAVARTRPRVARRGRPQAGERPSPGRDRTAARVLAGASSRPLLVPTPAAVCADPPAAMRPPPPGAPPPILQKTYTPAQWAALVAGSAPAAS